MPYKDSEAHKAAKAAWYQKNKQLTKDSALGSKRRTQDWFKEIKLNDIQCGCSICGVKTGNPDDYDYHHRKDSTKILCVADMLSTYGRKKTLAEMKKCDIVCKKCHIKIHHQSNHPHHYNRHRLRDPKTGRFIKGK